MCVRAYVCVCAPIHLIKQLTYLLSSSVYLFSYIFMQHYSLLVPEHVTGGELQDPLAKQDMSATPLISYPGLHA